MFHSNEFSLTVDYGKSHDAIVSHVTCLNYGWKPIEYSKDKGESTDITVMSWQDIALTQECQSEYAEKLSEQS